MFSGDDLYRPSFFELAAADRLVAGLKAPLQHICKVVSRRHPSLTFLRRYSDELYAALVFALEKHYLEQHDASFGEHFYGLRRVAATSWPLISSGTLAKDAADPLLYSRRLFGVEEVQAASAQRKAAVEREMAAVRAAADADSLGSASSAAASAASIAASSSSAIAAPVARSDSSSVSSSSSSSAAPLPGSSSFFSPLRQADRRRALFFLVVVPYIKQRLDKLYIRLRDGIDEEGFQDVPVNDGDGDGDGDDGASSSSLIRRLFLRVWPFLSSFYDLVHLVGSLRFLFDRSVFWSPVWAAIRQVIRRATMDEMNAPTPADMDEMRWRARRTVRAMESAWETTATATAQTATAASTSSFSLARLSPSRWLSTFYSRFTSFLSRYGSYGLLLCVLLFKFVEWWYSDANPYGPGAGGGGGVRGGDRRRLPVPPPPPRCRPALDGVDVPFDKSVCPLCEDERVNPAATPSGYVYCYTCIHAYLQANHQCPVTKRPCEVGQLRKIYDEN